MKTGECQNEHGINMSTHVCDTCGSDFTVIPAVENEGWESCMDPSCQSYDPKRDADPLFGGEPQKGKIVNLDAHRPHRTLEVICVKCAKRWWAVAPVQTPLKNYECVHCGSVGYIISTGQWMSDNGGSCNNVV